MLTNSKPAGALEDEMADPWRANAFRIEIGNMPAGTSLWISKVSIPKLDAATAEPRARADTWISKVSFPKADASVGDRRGRLTLRIPPDITRRATAETAYSRSMSRLTYETEVVERVRQIDGSSGMQHARKATATTVPGMLLVGFEPRRAGTRFIRRRSGSLIVLDQSADSGRIVVSLDTRTVASWRFDRGWFFALEPAPIAPGSPGNVLFVPEALRRG